MITESQRERRYHALSVNCKKVYDAVPISEPWSTSYILSEIQRVCSYTSNMRVLTGSLSALKASGLVLEPSKGVFMRTPVKPYRACDDSAADALSTPAQVSQPTEPETMKTTSTSKRAPMAILSDFSQRLRALAEEFDTAALEIAEQIELKEGEAAKLKQLQALLKDLS